MSDRLRYRLSHAEARHRAMEAVRTAPDGWHVVVSEPTRTLDQNATQWPILEAFASQAEWPVNGRMCKM
ncbi:MAG: recombination protein NinB, partial [Burkholderiaceae bacterium]|nr:recombination protein NinB [Burkholderiaceae bacterium]